MAKKKKSMSALPVEVQAAISELEKHYGKGSVMRLGDNIEFAEITGQIPSGSLALDRAIGIYKKMKDGTVRHGIPRGRVIEIYGPEACGKTTLCNHIISQGQKVGLCAMIDMEQSWDRQYASRVGVDTDNLLFSQPSCGEEALKTLEYFVKTNKFAVVVVDSIASLVPRAELEGEIDANQQPAGQARLMSQVLRKLMGVINSSQTLVVFTNQIREKVGVMFGNPETTPGGNAMKFYATLRFDMRKIAPLKDSMGEFIGHRCRVKLVKNKVAPPFQIAEFDMMYGFGIVPELDLIDCALETEVFTKRGAWIAFGEEMVGQGRAAAAEALASNETLGLAVKTKVMETYANAGEEVEKPMEVSGGTDGVVEPAQAGAGSPQG